VATSVDENGSWVGLTDVHTLAYSAQSFEILIQCFYFQLDLQLHGSILFVDLGAINSRNPWVVDGSVMRMVKYSVVLNTCMRCGTRIETGREQSLFVGKAHVIGSVSKHHD